MKKISLLLVIVLGLFLVACGASQEVNGSTQGIASAKSLPTATSPAQTSSGTEDMVRTDEQGMVAVKVRPINLNSPGNTLDFEVSMNTHSVNLNMNLAELATLSTDSGTSVQGVAWKGPAGGHHVSGTLSFPASVNGKSILEGATRLELKIKNVDAPERIFTWNLSK